MSYEQLIQKELEELNEQLTEELKSLTEEQVIKLRAISAAFVRMDPVSFQMLLAMRLSDWLNDITALELQVKSLQADVDRITNTATVSVRKDH